MPDLNDLEDLKAANATLIAQSLTLSSLDEARVQILGKNGNVTIRLKSLGGMSPDERREQGPLINGLRDDAAARIAERKTALDAAALEAQLAAEHVDLTLPAPPRRRGAVHPTMQVLDEMTAIFAEMGFSVAEGPDIEDDFHNFTALNFPPRHPAREMHDTFFFAQIGRAHV